LIDRGWYRILGTRNAPTIAAVNVRGPDGLVARKQGSTWTYYAFDQQGNVSQRLNASGTVVSSSVYDAYGAETTSGTAPTDVCGYNAPVGLLARSRHGVVPVPGALV